MEGAVRRGHVARMSYPPSFSSSLPPPPRRSSMANLDNVFTGTCIPPILVSLIAVRKRNPFLVDNRDSLPPPLCPALLFRLPSPFSRASGEGGGRSE